MNSTLGRSGIPTCKIGLGCATFGREITEAASFAIMDYAVEHGITLFDTAEAYGAAQARQGRKKLLGVDDVREVSDEMHSSEKIVGRWLRARGCRNRITLVTKISADFSGARVRAALEGSLERLQTDHVNAYLYHRFDPRFPAEEAVTAMDAVVTAGLTRAGGCSNYTGEQLATVLQCCERLGLARFEVIESQYNLVAREIEADVLPVTRQNQIGVLTYSPLAGSFLTGIYRSAAKEAVPPRSRFGVIPGYTDLYFNERGFRVLAQLEAMAKRTGVPSVKLAWAWTLQNSAITCVLAGALEIDHLANAIEAQKMDLPPAWFAEMNGW